MLMAALKLNPKCFTWFWIKCFVALDVAAATNASANERTQGAHSVDESKFIVLKVIVTQVLEVLTVG